MASGGLLCLFEGRLPCCGVPGKVDGGLDQQDAPGTDPAAFAFDVKPYTTSPPVPAVPAVEPGPARSETIPLATKSEVQLIIDEAAGVRKPETPREVVVAPYTSNHSNRSEEDVPQRPAGKARFLSSNTFASTGTHFSTDGGPMITFDDEFDFYEPNTKQFKIMKMADVKHDVLHQRDQKTSWMKRFMRRKSVDESANNRGGSAGADKDDCSSEASNSDSEDESSSRGDIDRSGSGSNSGDSKGSGSPAAGSLKRMPTTASAFDGENVTNWGILIAKLLRKRVNGICGAASRTIHKRRNSIPGSHAQYVLPSVRMKAQLVVDQAKSLAKLVAQETQDTFDSSWSAEKTIQYLFGEDYVDTLMLLSNTVRKVVAAQPILAEATAPCRVFGDIHGQLRDLLILFRAFGLPGERVPSFVFNGDFVDRGSHSLDVVGLLFALKIILPEHVWLVRGNHEDRSMNERYGFENECYNVLGADFGPKTYELIHRAFDELPIACLISERILVVHGGIGEGKWLLNDLRCVQRPLRERALAADPIVWNVLWSDPIEDDHAPDEKATFGVHASPRSSTGLYKFGWNVTKTFCAANGLGLIIRSHQSKEGSLGFSVMHDKMLVRVFSARDYEEHGNDGAVILISLKDPTRKHGPLVIRPQVVQSLTKNNDQDPNSTKKKRSGKKPWRLLK